MRPPLGALLAASLALPGCCGLQYAARGDRDTPERAFAFVRDAFVEDRTGDQFDSLHPEFRDAQGITSAAYYLARKLEPGTFEEAARILKDARIAGPVETRPVATRRGPRAGARVSLEWPGGSAVLLLVDEPALLLVTDDPEAGDRPVSYPGIDGAFRMEGDTLVVSVRRRLDLPPQPGARVLRFELHHDWQLYQAESFEGLEELLGQVREAATEAEDGSPRKEESPR